MNLLIISNINQIAKKFTNQIDQLYIEKIGKSPKIPLIKKFEGIYRVGSGNLRSFEKNILLLREKIDDPSFEKELRILNDKRMDEFNEKLMKNEPIEIIERKNNEIEVKYSKSFSVIKKKK